MRQILPGEGKWKLQVVLHVWGQSFQNRVVCFIACFFVLVRKLWLLSLSSKKTAFRFFLLLCFLLVFSEEVVADARKFGTAQVNFRAGGNCVPLVHSSERHTVQLEWARDQQ